MGSGPIGLATLQAVLCTKGVEATVVDLYESRLAIARKLGAKTVINAKDMDISKELNSGFDIVFETAGSVNLKPLITHRFSFEETEKALKFALENKSLCMKAIVQVSK